jgi:pilus assembly protein Flp/PilA
MNALARLRDAFTRKQNLARALRDRRGVTALEYGLIAALVAAAIVTAFGTFSTGLSTAFDNISETLTTTTAGTGGGADEE